MAELKRECHGDFVAYLRMEPAMFHELIKRLTPRLTKKDTNLRRCLSPGLKLAVTLRYLQLETVITALPSRSEWHITLFQKLLMKSVEQ